MIQIVLIAAAMLLAPVSAPAQVLGIGIQPQRTSGDAIRSAALPRVLLAQNAAIPSVSGSYGGNIDRRYLNGAPQASRTYRLTINPDMNTGKVLIYDLGGKLINEIGLIGKMVDENTFAGKTMVINATPTYKPDNVRLVFSPDRSSVEWYHNDGMLEGSGTLTRSGE